jgi:hypothetical protein
VGTLFFFVSPQIANPQIFGLIPQAQICTFLRCASPQIANPKICANRKTTNFLVVPVHKSQICKFARKQTVFLIQIRIGLPLILFYLHKYILDYEMPCISKLSQKPKVVLYFEREHLKLDVKRICNCIRTCLKSFYLLARRPLFFVNGVNCILF